jgi:hypothetical protein
MAQKKKEEKMFSFFHQNFIMMQICCLAARCFVASTMRIAIYITFATRLSSPSHVITVEWLSARLPPILMALAALRMNCGK